jgi:hypothetical protein
LDWEGLKRIAFGPLSLKPHEFWQLTMGELMDMWEGYKWRQEAELRKMAQLAVWVTAPHLRKPWSADKLLGKKQEKKKTTPEETKQVLGELIADMGGG